MNSFYVLRVISAWGLLLLFVTLIGCDALFEDLSEISPSDDQGWDVGPDLDAQDLDTTDFDASDQGSADSDVQDPDSADSDAQDAFNDVSCEPDTNLDCGCACEIDDGCQEEGDPFDDNPCQICDPGRADDEFVAADDGTACGDNRICVDGECVCDEEAGFTSCGTPCVDTDSDVDHCGGCGVPCQSNDEEVTLSCSEGKCEFNCSDSEKTYCSEADICADLDSDDNHCGACGNECDVGCADGKCVECMSDDDCDYDSDCPVCVDNQCRQCMSDDDCDNDYCHDSRVCVECHDDEHCTNPEETCCISDNESFYCFFGGCGAGSIPPTPKDPCVDN